MLLLDLPLELLHLVISLVSGPYDRKDYANRLKELRNCCLVSRAFRQIAQPELFAIIQVEDTKPLEAFRAAAKATGLGRSTATLVLRGRLPGEDGLTAEDVRAALAELPSLQEVRITWIEGIDMACLAGLPELRHLLLYHVTLTTSSPSFSLPRLVQLSACYIETEPSLDPACFSAETMPSLRLAAILADQDHRNWSGYLMSQLSPDLASKLEVMVIDFIDWSDVHSAPPSCGSRTTVLDSRNEDIVIAFTTLANMLATSHPAVSTLRSIDLPPWYEPRPGIKPELVPGMFAAYERLLSVMAQKGIEILIEAYPESDVDSYIPRRTLEWVN
ncbi:hypothetical protein JCM1840_005057 [Sporobolomyces johnsonii]